MGVFEKEKREYSSTIIRLGTQIGWKALFKTQVRDKIGRTTPHVCMGTDCRLMSYRVLRLLTRVIAGDALWDISEFMSLYISFAFRMNILVCGDL